MLKYLIKKSYYLFFSIYKIFKYPTCKIKTNWIHPKAKIGKYIVIEKFCKIDKGVEIGDYTYINEYTRIDANTASIGKYCSISHNVKIGMGPHPLHYVSTSPVFYSKAREFIKENTYDEYQTKGYTIIGSDVFIATNVVIYAGVKIGHGAVIAAGSVVTQNVPPYALVGGIPAKILKYRFSKNTVSILLKTKWWELDNNILLSIHKDMNNPIKFLRQLRKLKADNENTI